MCFITGEELRKYCMCQIEEGYGSVKLVVSGFTVWNCLYCCCGQQLE